MDKRILKVFDNAQKNQSVHRSCWAKLSSLVEKDKLRKDFYLCLGKVLISPQSSNIDRLLRFVGGFLVHHGDDTFVDEVVWWVIPKTESKEVVVR